MSLRNIIFIGSIYLIITSIWAMLTRPLPLLRSPARSDRVGGWISGYMGYAMVIFFFNMFPIVFNSVAYNMQPKASLFDAWIYWGVPTLIFLVTTLTRPRNNIMVNG